MDRCKQAVGAPVTLDKPPLEGEPGGLRRKLAVCVGTAWVGGEPRWVERTMGHGTQQQVAVRSWLPLLYRQEAEARGLPPAQVTQSQ